MAIGSLARSASETMTPRGESGPVVVCHLIASNFLGGPEKQILEHCVRLDSGKWRAVIGSFRENRSRVQITESAAERGVDSFLIDTRSPFSPWSVLQLRRHLKESGASLLITHGYKSNLVGYLATRFNGIPQIPFIRGYTAENWRIRRYEEIDRLLIRRLPRILCVSEQTRKLLAGYGVPISRVEAVHNAVSEQGVVKGPDLHREFNIPGKPPVIVAAGRLSVEKGHRFLISAMELLSRTPHPPHLLLFGTGVEEGSIREQARSCGIESRVHLAGFHSGIPRYLASADLVVNPSLSEGLPNVVLEAMAVGTPVVATTVGGVPELITSDESGWLVPPGDPELMAGSIENALSDPAEARRVGIRGQQRVARFFSFESQAQHLTRIYSDVLAH